VTGYRTALPVYNVKVNESPDKPQEYGGLAFDVMGGGSIACQVSAEGGAFDV
jgi:hypothetical protein